MSANVHYYDHPDGEDAYGKMLVTNKYALLTGLGWSTLDVLMVTKPHGYQQILGRYAYNTVPLMGMASAFTMTTYMATKLRGKDDVINYIIGGFAAGGVYGAWKRSVVAGCVSGLFLGIAGFLKKTSVQDGWEFFPANKRHGYQSLYMGRHDWTIMKDTPKGWTDKSE